MTHLLFFLGGILLSSSFLSSSTEETVKKTMVDLVEIKPREEYTCGKYQISTKLDYCSVFRSCDRVGIVALAHKLDEMADDNLKTIAHCNSKGKAQIRINKSPDVWKRIRKINCVVNGVDEKGKNTSAIEVEFEIKRETKKTLEYNTGPDTDIALRCISDGRAKFDVYHNKQRPTDDKEVGLYTASRIFIVYIFISLLGSASIMAVYYFMYLFIENHKLRRLVIRHQTRHDELWLSIDRSMRNEYDVEETWNAMPLIHQQVAVEAALLLQKYKWKKFTPELRQWVIDRGFPAGACEIILELAGLGDSKLPFFGPEERKEGKFNPEHKLDQFTERIESRIVDTLNYANRLRRRKIVFTDHRLLEIHHFILELILTTLGTPSHPTIHDADIPVMPRHAFGTRDDPREEEKEEKETQARMRRPHFLHHDWDEAQRLLGSEA